MHTNTIYCTHTCSKLSTTKAPLCCSPSHKSLFCVSEFRPCFVTHHLPFDMQWSYKVLLEKSTVKKVNRRTLANYKGLPNVKKTTNHYFNALARKIVDFVWNSPYKIIKIVRNPEICISIFLQCIHTLIVGVLHGNACAKVNSWTGTFTK